MVSRVCARTVSITGFLEIDQIWFLLCKKTLLKIKWRCGLTGARERIIRSMSVKIEPINFAFIKLNPHQCFEFLSVADNIVIPLLQLISKGLTVWLHKSHKSEIIWQHKLLSSFFFSVTVKYLSFRLNWHCSDSLDCLHHWLHRSEATALNCNPEWHRNTFLLVN